MTRKQIITAVSAALLSGTLVYFHDVIISYAEGQVTRIVENRQKPVLQRLDKNQDALTGVNRQLIQQGTKIDSIESNQKEIRQDLRSIIQILRN